MKKILYFSAALLCVCLAGCATPSSMILSDGREIQTLDTPAYETDTGFYEFRQIDGKLTRINKAEVKTIKAL